MLTISSSRQQSAKDVPGELEPVRLVTTYVGTLRGCEKFGQLARVEAERRGIRQALEVVVIGDGAAWIDTLAAEHFGSHTRSSITTMWANGWKR